MWSDSFSGPRHKRFEKVEWYSDNQSVFLNNACATLATELVEEITIGDHTLAVLHVLNAAEFATARPLVFHGSQITTIN